MQAAMEKHQVDAEPFVIDPQAALAADEREIIAQLEEECLEMADQSVFKVGFGIFILQVEEFQNERVFDFLLGGQGSSGLAVWPLRSMAALSRESRVRS